jgi:5-methylthioadenosine/S-adenosylhomocysteine deaminase
MDKFDVSGPGVIAEGRRADLIGLKRDSAAHWTPEYRTTSNLVYSGKSSDVEMVMVDGKMIMVDGKIKTVDEGKVLDKVQEISQKYDKIRKNHK